MKCPGCDGKGFIEKHYGLVMVKCSECKGTGEIDMEEEAVEITNNLQGGMSVDNAANPRTDEADKPARSAATRKSPRSRKRQKSRAA